MIVPSLGSLLLALAPLFAGASPAPAARSERPNILFILADDLGWGDLGSYGNAKIRTPHIDALAAEGMRFTSFYAAASICTPSRAALLTGRVPERSGMGDRLMWPRSTDGLRPDEITLPGLLRDAGYTTACVGKWHLGHLPPFLPTRHGFDSYFGIPYSNDMTPLVLMRGEQVLESYQAPPEIHNFLTTITVRYTDEVLSLLQRAGERPFFIYLAHSMPHPPWAASPRFAGKSGGGPREDAIEELDWSVGETLAALKARGLDANTIVVFASDNGGPSNKTLRGGKSSFFEGGLRVPCIVRWPGHVAAGRVENRPASLMDFLPTLVALAGGRLPKEDLDGRGIEGVLLGTGARGGEDFAWSRRAYRSGAWKIVRENGNSPRFSLFNVDDDPGETKDLAAQHPEIAERLEAAFARFRSEAKPPPPLRKR